MVAIRSTPFRYPTPLVQLLRKMAIPPVVRGCGEPERLGIDGNLDLNYLLAEVPFATTDHCGRLQVLDEAIDSDYVYWNLKATKERYGFCRVFRASLTNVRAETEISILTHPSTGRFNLATQRLFASRMRKLTVPDIT